MDADLRTIYTHQRTNTRGTHNCHIFRCQSNNNEESKHYFRRRNVVLLLALHGARNILTTTTTFQVDGRVARAT